MQAALAASSISASVASAFPRAMFARTVSVLSMTSWKTSDIDESSSREGWSRTSRPLTSTVPESTSQNRAMSLASVDFPPPEGPTSAVTVPGGHFRESSWMTGSPGS